MLGCDRALGIVPVRGSQQTLAIGDIFIIIIVSRLRAVLGQTVGEAWGQDDGEVIVFQLLWEALDDQDQGS